MGSRSKSSAAGSSRSFIRSNTHGITSKGRWPCRKRAMRPMLLRAQHSSAHTHTHTPFDSSDVPQQHTCDCVLSFVEWHAEVWGYPSGACTRPGTLILYSWQQHTRPYPTLPTATGWQRAHTTARRTDKTDYDPTTTSQDLGILGTP